MSNKVRQLSKEEILPEDLNIAAVTINRTIEFYSAPESMERPEHISSLILLLLLLVYLSVQYAVFCSKI